MKRKWINFDLKEDSKLNASKTSNVTTVDHVAESITTSKQLKPFNYFQKISPKTASDLAVHPKKIKEVEEWLEINVIKNTAHRVAPLLLITGPTGSGKTATVNVICKNLGIKVSEWVNPIDQDYEISRGQGQSAKFLEFLMQTKYSSLTEDSNYKIGLVEDFPNSVIHKPEEFFSILETLYCKLKSAIIFICTEGGNSLNLPYQLFPQNVRDQYNIVNISFNACSNTLLKNAIKRAENIIKERLDLFVIPSSDVTEAIVVTSGGDIRCAMNQFLFASSKDSSSLEIEKTVKSIKKRKISGKSNSKLKGMNKDEALTLFHGIGRILNPKRTNKSDGTWRLDCDLESVITTFSSNPRKCINFLHHNYLKHYGDLDDVYRCLDMLSFSQRFFASWSEEYDKITIYGLWTAVLGVMISNEHKVSKWGQITAPMQTDNRLFKSQKTDLDKSYYNLIEKSKIKSS